MRVLPGHSGKTRDERYSWTSNCTGVVHGSRSLGRFAEGRDVPTHMVVAPRRGPYGGTLTSSVPPRRDRLFRGADSCSRCSEDENEAAVSAQSAQTGQEARVPIAHEHPRRSCRPARSAPEGPHPVVGVIGRLTGRAAFARLRAEGVRAGRGPIRLVSRADPAQNALIAFAIPRSVGSAVGRNRIKRRIRSVLRELAREDPGFPTRGDHLIRVTAPIDEWSHTMLRNTMRELLILTKRTSP